MTKQNEYAKTLIKCQNVCFAISKLAQVQQGSNTTQLPNLYKVGDFVLLKNHRILFIRGFISCSPNIIRNHIE